MNASAPTSTEQREAVTGAVAGKGPACRGGVPTLSSHRSGKCSRISRGSASAAKTTNSAMPRFSDFVASLAPSSAACSCKPAASDPKS